MSTEEASADSNQEFIREQQRVNASQQRRLETLERLVAAAVNDPLWLARYYREMWLDETEDSTGNRRPRMGDIDPLGDDPVAKPGRMG